MEWLKFTIALNLVGFYNMSRTVPFSAQELFRLFPTTILGHGVSNCRLSIKVPRTHKDGR